MARQESDREDLLAEATALVERIELAESAKADAEHIVAGFRREGALSLYFGPDPVYHFNPAGELRRAYIGGWLYKARDHRLVAMQRVRTEGEVQLVSQTLDADQQRTICRAMHDRLSRLARQIKRGELAVVGQVPAEADVLGRVARWLEAHGTIPIARRPNAI